MLLHENLQHLCGFGAGHSDMLLLEIFDEKAEHNGQLRQGVVLILANLIQNRVQGFNGFFVVFLDIHTLRFIHPVFTLPCLALPALSANLRLRLCRSAPDFLAPVISVPLWAG